MNVARTVLAAPTFLAVLLVLAALASPAWAHGPAFIPTLRCWSGSAADRGHLVCEVGRTDGEIAPQAAIEIVDEQGERLHQFRADRVGRARFPRPAGDFRVRYRVGINSVEVTGRDVEATPLPPAERR